MKPDVTLKLKLKQLHHNYPDIRDLLGHAHLKRALMVAAAGGHHMLLFGPPGSGKRLACTIVQGLLPDLSPLLSHAVTCLWTQAGQLSQREGMIVRPPFRMPHHSLFRMTHGGGGNFPGEISLAHGGVLFLDNAQKFQGYILRSLRESLETRQIMITRRNRSTCSPSQFQLLMTAQPCPCGLMGKPRGRCECKANEISGYWQKAGGALLDLMDLRIPVEPFSGGIMLMEGAESSFDLRERTTAAVQKQFSRFANKPFLYNRDIPAAFLQDYCPLDSNLKEYFNKIARLLHLTSSARHSILKVARTIADLGGRERIIQDDLEEASQYRRYGEGNDFWNGG